MHYIRCFLVEVNPYLKIKKEGNIISLPTVDYEELTERVKEKVSFFLDSYEGILYDYYDTEIDEDIIEGYQNGVIFGIRDKEAFLREMEDYKDRYISKIKSLQELTKNNEYSPKIEKIFKGNFNFDTDTEDDNWFFYYRLGSLIKLLNREVDGDSSFIDTEFGGSYFTKKRYEEIINNPENYALVYVDCHL